MHVHASRTQWLLAIMLLALGLAFGPRSAWAQEAFGATHFAAMSGDDEVPPVVGGGQGIAFIRLDASAGTAEYRVSVALPPSDVITMAHFHRGPEGVSGPPIHTINFPAGSNTATGTWTGLTAEDILALNNGGIYVNVHTERNPNGQIRGQVGPIPNFSTIRLSSDQEAPPATGSKGSGSAVYWFDPDNMRLGYHIEWDSLSGPPTMAHFHRGEVGVSGPVVHPITLPNAAGDSGEVNGVWENLTPSDLSDLFTNKLYVNIHTAQNPSGEIRGQVLRSEFFIAAISAANEAPPSSGSGMMGTGFVILTSDNKLTGIFIAGKGTGPITMAHIHRGAVGVSGPVVMPLTGLSDFWFLPSQSDVSTDVQNDLRAMMMYVNFHTSQFPNGEARGQLTPAATNFIPPSSAVPALAPDATGSAVAAWYDGASNAIRFRTATGTSTANARVILFSPLGRELASIAAPGESGRIASEGLPAGVYFLQLVRDGAPAGFSRVAIVR